MKISRPIAKQIGVAVYSSPAISALTVTPMFMLGAVRFELYPSAFGFSAALVFVFWMANIGIWMIVDRNETGRAWLRYVLSYVLCIVFGFFLFHDMLAHVHRGRFESPDSMHFHLILFFAIDSVLLILQDLTVTREKNARIELENSRLRMRDMEAMNLRLAGQVHPHFLFNSLSTLKALISVSPEQAGEYLMRLSGFLRSSMTDEGLVRAGKELQLCADYLAMQRIRFGDALRFSISVPAEVQASFSLPFFSVQLLIENAIKHNVLTPDRPLSIEVGYSGGGITVSNNLQRKEGESSEGMGSGLNNLRERYLALGGYPVLIEESEDRFSVRIKLLTHEPGDH